MRLNGGSDSGGTSSGGLSGLSGDQTWYRRNRELVALRNQRPERRAKIRANYARWYVGNREKRIADQVEREARRKRLRLPRARLSAPRSMAAWAARLRWKRAMLSSNGDLRPGPWDAVLLYAQAPRFLARQRLVDREDSKSPGTVWLRARRGGGGQDG